MFSANFEKLIPGWEFINLFHDTTKQLYHCRIREIAPKKLLDLREVTGTGATVEIAFENAVKLV